MVWVGGIDDGDQNCELDLSCYGETRPVRITAEQNQRYYIGFCKSLLWPLLHYEAWQSGFRRKDWSAYQDVNRAFADTIASIYQPGDYIWVQDYHLMLVPALLRKRCQTAPISFYLHSPFPSSELYRVLPVREDLLKGMLGANVLGFQIWDYSRHFISACNRILRAEDLETTHKMVTYALPNGSRTRSSVVISPSGIEPELYSETLQMASVKKQIEELRDKFSGKKVIFGCDPLESSRGLVQKFEAFEGFLTSNPSWKGKVVLVQMCPKSQHTKGRENVEVHKRLCHQINELVGRINGKFGTPDYCPLIYLTSPPSFAELCAFYHVADVYLLSSLRDGLNLGPSEFVACQVARRGGPGVALVSEFAGANQSLSGSIRINPWDFFQVSLALERALTMELEERREKHTSSLNYTLQSTALAWAQSLMTELEKSVGTVTNKIPPVIDPATLVSQYENARRRLLILDYDGTLVPIARKPGDAIPSERLLASLSVLSQDPRNSIYVVSGRDRDVLDKWIGHIPIGMSAEHGCFIKHAATNHSSSTEALQRSSRQVWENTAQYFDDSWRRIVKEIFEDYKDRTPGSEIEFKTINITWHYRNADPYYAEWVSKELLSHLMLSVASKMPIEVITGKKAIEVRPKGVNKGAVVRSLLNTKFRDTNFDFVLCVGDDRTDEDMFVALNDASYRHNAQNYHTIVVEERVSEAKNSLARQSDVIDLLEKLSHISQ